jgi:hypothetical protein
MDLTTRLQLVKPTHGINEVEGETATGQPNEAWNLDQIDAAISALQDKSGVNDYLASGAITQKSGIVTLSKSSAAAVMTLADPTTGAQTAGGDDGKRLAIISKTAQAHTVATITGISSGANHKSTFGGAIGDMLNLVALGGVWYLEPSINQTLSAS